MPPTCRVSQIGDLCSFGTMPLAVIFTKGDFNYGVFEPVDQMISRLVAGTHQFRNAFPRRPHTGMIYFDQTGDDAVTASGVCDLVKDGGGGIVVSAKHIAEKQAQFILERSILFEGCEPTEIKRTRLFGGRSTGFQPSVPVRPTASPGPS